MDVALEADDNEGEDCQHKDDNDDDSFRKGVAFVGGHVINNVVDAEARLAMLRSTLVIRITASKNFCAG